MKYIRTKDEIVEVKNEFEYIVAGIVIDDVFFADSEIIDEADTIEELCDEFVMNNEIIVGSPRDGMNRLQLADYYAKNDKNVFGAIWVKNDKNVFGAIWVKGVHNEPILKSVAKMNDKGELELL